MHYAASTTGGYDGVGCSGFLNNRYQDPTTSTFLSVDPLVSSTGHPYDYANNDNNPTTMSDPSGLCAVTVNIMGQAVTGDDGKGTCESDKDGHDRGAPPGPAGNPVLKRRYFEVDLGDWKTVNRVAKDTDIDPFVLLIVYRKEREGWQKDQDSAIRWLADIANPGGDVGRTMGVTNVSRDLFESMIERHGEALGKYGLTADSGEEDWEELNDGSQSDVEQSLALTSFILQDLAVEFAEMNPSSLDAVTGVTPYEWSMQSYRYAVDTVLDLAGGRVALGPNVRGEIELFRREYAELEILYGTG